MSAAAGQPLAEGPLLEVRGLSVDIRTPAGDLHAVRDIAFDVGRGEAVCLVGESGCGKSITSLAVMGLLPRAAESRATRLAFGGVDLMALGRRARNRLRGRRMAMIFQEPMTALNPAWTIGEQMIEVHRRHMRQGSAAATARAVDLLAKVGIASPA
jgi:peptide/nickel transport system ATP-binding protein